MVITDLSSDGCRIVTHHMLPIGDIVQLIVLGQNIIAASVRWSMLGKAGLRFV